MEFAFHFVILFSHGAKRELCEKGRLFLDLIRTGLNRFSVGFSQSFSDISFLLLLLASCLPTLRLLVFYTLLLTLPPPGLFVIGCPVN